MKTIQKLARQVSGTLGRDSWLIRHLRPTYESLLDWSGRGIPWDINGVEYRIDPRFRAQLGANYDATVAAYLANRIGPGDVCYDVGANVGAYVLQLAHWSKPGGRVVAFEPNPQTREALRRHVEMNGLADRVQIEPLAVGSAPSKVDFHVTGADGRSRMSTPNPELAGKSSIVTVDVTTLDDYWERTGLDPDWLVIDIEGLEVAALAGARRMIKSRRDRLGVIVEMHPGAWPWAGTSRAALEELLVELEVVAVPLMGQRDPLAEHGSVLLSPN